MLNTRSLEYLHPWRVQIYYLLFPLVFNLSEFPYHGFHNLWLRAHHLHLISGSLVGKIWQSFPLKSVCFCFFQEAKGLLQLEGLGSVQESSSLPSHCPKAHYPNSNASVATYFQGESASPHGSLPWSWFPAIPAIVQWYIGSAPWIYISPSSGKTSNVSRSMFYAEYYLLWNSRVLRSSYLAVMPEEDIKVINLFKESYLIHFN